MALTLVSCKIPTAETPVVGVTLDPYVLVRRAESGVTATADEVPEEGLSDARYSLRFRWYRSQINKSGLVCCVHSDREATLQCTICARHAQTATEKRQSYHCSSDCLKQHWTAHRELHIKQHKRAQGFIGHYVENGYSSHFPDATSRGSYTNSNNETWVEVGRGRKFTPLEDDCHSTLKVDVVVIDSLARTPYSEIGKTFTSITQRVRSAPKLPQRALVTLPAPKVTVSAGKFSVLTYNLLADLYTNSDMFTCPSWLLAWGYRRQNLLSELIHYNADIMCLQEVQSNHFQEFLAPELQKHGYTAIYKKKTKEMYTGHKYAIDGCATFFRRDRFALVKKYEVEFNKAALSLAESLGGELRKVALNRLLKDNVALIAVLEALDPPSGADPANPSRRQLICVANTHIHANPELNDVKLWQVHTLLKGLEKIAASADIPMLVAGDFNSTPGSAAHDLLTRQSVSPEHKELKNDPLGIFRPPTKLQHNLPLSSAYASLADSRGSSAELQKQRRCLDGKTKEPKFTNWSKGFKGTLDYIFHTSESLVPVATLELPDEAEISKYPGLPNECWSSDHIALLAEFQYVQS